MAIVPALLLGLLLAGCSAEQASQTADPDPENQITVFGPWRGAPAQSFREAVDGFEAETGIRVVYTGTGSFAPELATRVEEGDLPDLAIFPQPGLMQALAAQGHVLPLPSGVAQAVDDAYRPELARLMDSLDRDLGLLLRLNVKSLVWYPPTVFEDQGYEVPRTWQQLDQLAGQMVEDGFVPWCLGVEDFGASGWPATDWIEDIVLREQGAATYDAWTSGDLPFTNRAIASAFDSFERMALRSGRVLGGRSAVLNTSTAVAGLPILDDPPGCLMYRQASFNVEDLPEGTTVGSGGDTNVFVLPSTRANQSRLTVGGTMIAAMSGRPEVGQLLSYLATSPAAHAAGASPGLVSPFSDAHPDEVTEELETLLLDILADADVIRFDGSDLMDPAVGTDSFLDAMEFFIGTLRLDDSLELAQLGYSQ